MTKIQVLLVDDHTLMRKGLRSLLEEEESVTVIGEAADGHQALEEVMALMPDVVLMDITMPRLNGIEATRQLKQRFPQVRVIMLTMHESEEYIFQALRAGASGYVLKGAAVAELVTAVQAVFRGDSYLSPTVSRKVVEEYVRHANAAAPCDPYETVTVREREVLQLIAEGRSTREIAALLHISIKTVETHRAHLIEKIGLRSTAELTQYAMRKGLI